jgi:hypothetical protein
MRNDQQQVFGLGPLLGRMVERLKRMVLGKKGHKLPTGIENKNKYQPSDVLLVKNMGTTDDTLTFMKECFNSID